MAFKETYNIDASQAERALKNLAEAQKKVGENADVATKKLSAEDKAARRIAEAADPMKKFNRQLEETAVLVNKGKVSLEDAAVVVGKYQQRLDHAGKTGEATFGQRAISQLTSYATGIVSVGAVISGVRAIFATMRKEADAAAERIKASLDAIGALQQIEDFGGNDAFIKELRKRGVVKDASQGAVLANNLDQAGFNQEEQELIAFKLIRERVLDAASGSDVATKYAKVRSLLNIGSLEETINKVFEAGGESSATNPEVADAVTKYGGLMSSLGYGADEVLAMIDNADRQAPNVAGGAERLKSLGNQLSKKGLVKGSFLDTINAIRDRERAGENINAILGDANAVLGYQAFDEESEQSAFSRKAGLVGSAQQRDVLGQNMRGGLMANPTYAAAVNAQAARGALEVEQEARNGELQLLFQEKVAAGRLHSERQGNRFLSAFSERSAEWDRYLGTERESLSAAMASEFQRGNRGDAGIYSKDFEDRVLAFLERTANNTDPQANPSAE